MYSIRVLAVDDIREEMQRIDVHPYGIQLMADKASFFVVKIEHVDHRIANILKQEMLSLGAEAACSKEIMLLKRGRASVLLFGTRSQFKKLFQKLSLQPFGLKEMALRIKEVLENSEHAPLKTMVMGILNVTPDSFSDGGKYLDTDLAFRKAMEMVSEGADSIDVGGESTRPGSKPISVEEELKRVLPVIRRIVRHSSIPLSIDTYKSEVARRCISEGVRIVNDISALRADNKMAALVARSKVKVVLMHMQGTPRTMQKKPYYRDVVGELYSFLKSRIAYAEGRGIKKDSLIIDPGIGFGKTPGHNAEILNKIHEFKSLGCTLLVGASRKSFIGKILHQEPEQRLFGSLAIAAWSAINGVDMVRVHDVKPTKDVITVLSAMRK